jgi:hypothetical protein
MKKALDGAKMLLKNKVEEEKAETKAAKGATKQAMAAKEAKEARAAAKMCGGQPSPHKPRLVVSHSTCPLLSSSPHAHSFVLGTAVINTHEGGESRGEVGEGL